MVLVSLALVVFVLLGVTFGWLAWFRLRDMERRLRGLQGELQLLSARLALRVGRAPGTGGEPSPDPRMSRGPEPGQGSGSTAGSAAPDPGHAPLRASPAPPGAPAPGWTETLSPASGPATAVAQADAAGTGFPNPPGSARPGSADGGWGVLLRQYWMILLGGACLGLAGVFLVRYSIEQGLLGPTARVISALLLGLALHAGAESLRRRQGVHPALAGLAAGGSLTLFAALLAALHLYQLLSPALAFLALAAVALGTLLLALRHGPLLAALGLLGAYTVPLLVGEGTGRDWVALAYALLVSAAALMLLSQVRRQWLWWGALAGGLAWWELTASSDELAGLRGPYLAALGYLLLALPWFDFSLSRRSELPFSSLWRHLPEDAGLDARVPWALLLLVLVQMPVLFDQPPTDALLAHALLSTLPLTCLLLRSASQRRNALPLAWALLLAQFAGWLLSRGNVFLGRLTPWPADLLSDFLWYCLLSTAAFTGLALLGYRRRRPAGALLSLAVLAPPLHLALAWLLSGPASASLQWTLFALLLGASGVAFAGWRLARGAQALEPAWLLIAGHAAYSLAAAFQLREAGLSFALTLQILSLAWAIRRFRLPVLGTVLKGVVTLVLLRLSLNPWLVDYPLEGHWTLWAYGGSALCSALATALLTGEPRLRAWTLGAALHLFTLFVWVELRWLLYGGEVFAARFDFLEACLGMNLAGTLGLVYHWRARASSQLAWLYRGYAKLLLILALLAYALILRAVLAAEPWALEVIGTRALFNLLPLAFAAPVLLGLLARHSGEASWRLPAAAFSAFAGFVFISLEIRHLWTGSIDLHPPYSNGELYSYSAVWLALALTAILGGAWRWGRGASQAGMALLALVLAKLFLVDLAGLEGLLRVASFLGMGLSLLAIAYLHQRLGRTAA